MDFDTVLEKCGNFHRYQIILLFLYGFINILSSFHYFTQTIITFTPKHWCYHDSLQNLTFKEIQSKYANAESPHCTPFDVINSPANVTLDAKCDEWIFEYDRDYRSVTTELKWVCGDAYKSAVGQSLFYIGSVMGTMFFGFLADHIGRMKALMLTTLAGACGDFLTSFMDTLPKIAISRFIAGLSTDTIFMLMYIMVFEYLSPKKRTFGLNIIQTFFYCFGIMISPWLAVWVGTWRYYLLIASIPAIGVLAFPFLICESAQWLITREDYVGAVNCLKRVCHINKRHVDDAIFEEFVKFYKNKLAAERKLKEKKDTFLDMFKTPRLRKYLIILLLKSMIITLSFDIISRNMEGLGSSPFMLFSISAIVYIPAGLTIILLQNIIGRKGMASLSLLVGAIITAVTGTTIALLEPENNAVFLAIMISLGRYGAIVAYDAEAQYAAEILPTCVRGTAVANVHVVGYACSFLSAYVIFLGNFYKPLPSLFISALMFVGAALCLALPETLDKKLPETLHDGEMFGIGEKWYYFPCFSRKKIKCSENC